MEKTAFVCQEGVFQFRVLPFGLKSASQNFQNLVDVVLSSLAADGKSVPGIPRRSNYAYIDDIVIHSPDTLT